MRIGLLGLLLVAWAAAPAWGDERPLVFRVTPGGASILEVGSGSSLVEAQPVAPSSTYTLSPDTETVHHYVVHRPPFDDLPLAIQWDASTRTWQRQTPTGLDPVDIHATFELSRTIAVHTFPNNPTVWVPTDVGTSLQLPVLNGRVTIPSAWHPPPLTLTRDLFEPYLLTIPDGALDRDAAEYPSSPVLLHPRYGPLSYWQFDAAAVLLGLGAWGRREWRRRHVPAVTPVESSTAAPPSSGRPVLDWVQSQPLVTDSGRHLAVHEKLGQGGVGVVFAATCSAASSLGPLAVKVLLPDHFQDPKARARFLREARLCSTLHHPAVVRVVDWGMAQPPAGEEACPFLVMERLEGDTLRAVLRDGLPLAATALTWTAQLLDALEVVHQAGIIHRDLKPENVMVLPGGDLKLMDFGVARELDGESLTRSGTLIGTPAYMSPEHFNARTVQPSSDVYSAGVMLYEMLSGSLPYEPGDLWVMAGQILIGSSISLEDKAPHLSPAIVALVRQMMATAPTDRFQTAAQASAAVLLVLNRPGDAPPVS